MKKVTCMVKTEHGTQIQNNPMLGYKTESSLDSANKTKAKNKNKTMALT